MTPPKVKVPITRLAYTVPEAAASLGVGETSFKAHVMPHIKVWREGSIVRVPCSELQRFLDASSERTLPDESVAT